MKVSNGKTAIFFGRLILLDENDNVVTEAAGLYNVVDACQVVYVTDKGDAIGVGFYNTVDGQRVETENLKVDYDVTIEDATEKALAAVAEYREPSIDLDGYGLPLM